LKKLTLNKNELISNQANNLIKKWKKLINKNLEKEKILNIEIQRENSKPLLSSNKMTKELTKRIL